jgi:hypothetical protein
MPFLSQTARTRVKWHRRALTASFADASPAMIWRWNRDELPTGFVLRSENGQLHLRQRDAAGEESTLAVFPSATAAARALDLLSRSLLGGPSFGRILTTLLAILGVLVSCLLVVGYWDEQHGQAVAAKNSRAPAPALMAGPAPVAPTAPAPTTPVPGTPVDVDQVYK